MFQYLSVLFKHLNTFILENNTYRLISMTKSKRIDKGKVARAGASKRKFPSKPATFIHQMGLDKGRVLDYGSGYGLDAETFSWESFDPYYNDIKLNGLFDTIICINVISAVSAVNETIIINSIIDLLKPNGKAYLSVPRNLPKEGKLSGYNRRPQRWVTLNYPSIEQNSKFEIYLLEK